MGHQGLLPNPITSDSSEVKNNLITSFTAELRFAALSFDPRKINKKESTIDNKIDSK